MAGSGSLFVLLVSIISLNAEATKESFEITPPLPWSRPNSKDRPTRLNRASRGWGDSEVYIKEQFEKYYKCVNDRVSMITEKGHHITAVIALLGQNLELDCNVCFRPDQSEGHIEWQQISREDSTVRLIEDGGRFKITKHNDLLISDVDMTDVGQIMCLFRDEYQDIFQVDVLQKEKRRLIDDGEPVLLPQIFIYNNLKLFTSWSQWSMCNNCDRPGQRRKIGVCMIKKLDPEEPIEPKDFPLFELYPDGLPCRSTALPHYLWNKEEVRTRPSETIIGNCSIPCPTHPPSITVTDSSGKVVEIIEDGYYSMNSPPKLPPMIKSIVRFEDAGIHLILQCPKIKSSLMVRWHKGPRAINPLTIKQQTRRRVWIDDINRLHIGRLLMTDTDSYNCFVKKRHVANLRIIVVQAFNESLKNYISYAGFVLTAFLFLVLTITICKNKHRRIY